MADSVSIFAEGTFEEQIQDLVNYLVRNKSDEERTAFIQPFQEALKAQDKSQAQVIQQVLEKISGYGDGTDKEIEGFFNLLFAHLLSSHGPSLDKTLPPLLSTLESSAPSDKPLVKFQVLSNLFAGLPRNSPHRLSVYNSLLRLASSSNNLDIMHITKSDIEQWFSEWPSTPDEKSKLLKDIVDAFAKADQPPQSYEFLLYYVRQLSPSSSDYQNAAVDLIATSLRSPTNFDFDTLLTVNAVVAVKDHPLFSLLHIFLNDGLTELRTWTGKHSDVLSQYALDSTALERKIRLLALASLGFKNVGQQVPYSTIASTIDIPLPDVEKWVIDVIRTNLLSGKLSQTSQALYVTRSTSRTFEKEQWELLEGRLVSWKKSLEGVLDVIGTARKQAGNVAAPSQQAQKENEAAPVKAEGQPVAATA